MMCHSEHKDYIMCPLYFSVSDGLCSTAEKDPVVFGFNKTSGCLLPVSLQNLTECNFLRSEAQHEHVDLNKMFCLIL